MMLAQGRHNEAYHRLRCCMGVTEEREQPPRASGFSRLRREDVRACLASGGEQHLVARVGQFLRIMGHQLDEVGLLCEL